MNLKELGYKYTTAMLGRTIKATYVGGNEVSPCMWISFEDNTVVKLAPILGILVPIENRPDIDHEAAFALKMIDLNRYQQECQIAEAKEEERKRQCII